MNNLILQDSNFCDITIVLKIKIHKEQEEYYPLDLSSFLLKNDNSKSRKLKKQRDYINILTLNMAFLYNITEEIYGVTRDNFWFTKGSKRILNCQMQTDFEEILKLIPEKYIIKENYHALFHSSKRNIPVSEIITNIKFPLLEIIKIKSEALSYLKINYNFNKYQKIIKLLTKLSQGKTNDNFDDVIDKWSKELLRGNWKIKK